MIAAALVALYMAVLVGMAIAHHRPGHNPTPPACERSQGKAPEKNPHCRTSPSPSPTATTDSNKGNNGNSGKSNSGKSENSGNKGKGSKRP